jgi:hypothetical protein
MNDIRIADPKSVLQHVRRTRVPGSLSSKNKEIIESLQKQRSDTQEEISKLILILEDNTFPLTDSEIMDANTEVNQLMEFKSNIEKELAKVSNGDLNFVSVRHEKTLYFGRAKVAESVDTRRKPADTPVVIKGDNIEDSIAALRIRSEENKIKRTRFDDESD